MEINVEISKVMEMSRLPPPIQNMTDRKQLENVECFNDLGSFITNDKSCTCKII